MLDPATKGPDVVDGPGPAEAAEPKAGPHRSHALEPAEGVGPAEAVGTPMHFGVPVTGLNIRLIPFGHGEVGMLGPTPPALAEPIEPMDKAIAIIVIIFMRRSFGDLFSCDE